MEEKVIRVTQEICDEIIEEESKNGHHHYHLSPVKSQEDA
jgi:hypothetical protein